MHVCHFEDGYGWVSDHGYVNSAQYSQLTKMTFIYVTKYTEQLSGYLLECALLTHIWAQKPRGGKNWRSETYGTTETARHGVKWPTFQESVKK